MIKVLTAAVLGTIIGVVVMVVVIAIYGTDTSGASSQGLGSLPISTYSTSTPASTPSSTPTSTPSTGGGGSTGGGATGDPVKGKELVTGAGTCSGCHVVEPGATATVGPNLADLAPSLDEATILTQIENGGGAMPAGLLSGQDAKDAAAYILSLANQ
jgi:cytochrome c551